MRFMPLPCTTLALGILNGVKEGVSPSDKSLRLHLMGLACTLRETNITPAKSGLEDGDGFCMACAMLDSEGAARKKYEMMLRK